MKFMCHNGHSFVVENVSEADWNDNGDGRLTISLQCPICEKQQDFFAAKKDVEECIDRKIEDWYLCPHCGKKLFPLNRNTRIEHLPYRCKACKHDIEVNI